MSIDIYELNFNTEYQWLVAIEEKSKPWNIPDLDRNKTITLKENWKPFKVDYYLKSYKKPDRFMFYAEIYPIFTEKAVKFLGEFFNKSGELLPVEAPEGRILYLYNSLTILDIVDRDKSFYLDSYKEIDRLRRLFIKSYINIEELNNIGIFALNFPPYSRILYVTQKFVETVIEKKLKGFLFRRVTGNFSFYDESTFIKEKKLERKFSEVNEILPMNNVHSLEEFEQLKKNFIDAYPS